uniref:Nematode cuticle collagen N-terminal domain-containing protein n=1 Tax=Angiostrongylus cantonensis TaxID=6313 RepID=A0A0K0D5T9_ANGCA
MLINIVHQFIDVILDCTIIRYPRGERGSAGSNGIPAEYAKPGMDGYPGIDGLFLWRKIACLLCPPGPPNNDDLQGEQGNTRYLPPCLVK